VSFSVSLRNVVAAGVQSTVWSSALPPASSRSYSVVLLYPRHEVFDVPSWRAISL
jgi:hypothetical protein